MLRQNWMLQVFVVSFLWIFPVSVTPQNNQNNRILPDSQQIEKLKGCLTEGNINYVVADNFYGIISASKQFTAKLEGKNGPILEVLPEVVEVVLRKLNKTLSTGSHEVPQVLGQLSNAVKDILDNNSIIFGKMNNKGGVSLEAIEQHAKKVANTAQVQPVLNLLHMSVPVLMKLFTNKTIWDSANNGVVQSVLGNIPDLLMLFLNTSSGNSGLESFPERASDLLKLVINKTVFAIGRGASTERNHCVIFLQKNATRQKPLWKDWPQVNNLENLKLYIPKRLRWNNVEINVLDGKNCLNSTELCSYENLHTKTLCEKNTKYVEQFCTDKNYNDKYIINITKSRPTCFNCDNPVKKPDETIKINTTAFESDEGEVDASKAVEFMTGMGDLISKMNGTSAELSVAKGIEGVIVRKTDPKELDEVSFAYMDPNDKLKIIEDSKTLATFSRSVSVSKEAFEKAVGPNSSLPFAAVLRFMNLSRDERNSSVLHDEVVAIEMGTEIKNLTDTININFKNAKFDKFYPNCSSWNGEGSRPNWTTEGCETIVKEKNITCKCSHLTFFAVLLTPINETISSSDLNILTIITQVGCGLSVFFLGIVLFMYFLIRKTKASTATQILIHLVCALFLLNLTFLVNPFVAKLNSPVGCEVMAAVMHYSMLATFSWFAAQGFHLCLQLYRGGNIAIRHYVLKVSVITWTLPSIAVITLGSLKKYGKQIIYTDNPQNDVAMCWIIDNNVHYIVNIGYYSVVFLFTFTTVIITLSWLFCLKRSKAANQQENGSGRRIVIILGLCCQMGVTWGFAFFAYGSFRLAATYIFTILNSFQGFFLFIYYYKTTRVGPSGANAKGNSESTNSSISTLKTGLECVVNPYVSFEKQKDM